MTEVATGPAEALALGFARACARVPVFEGAYRFAGRPARLRVAGAELARRLDRAFAHLRDLKPAEGRSELVIELWDEAETGVPGPWEPPVHPPEREWIASGGMLAASGGGRCLTFTYEGSATLLDRSAQRILGCRRAGSFLCPSESSKPLVLLLSVWLYDRGVQLLHAGLVACEGRGILLPGEGGTGKSTTSLLAAEQGLEFLGDDFVGLEATAEGGLVGHSVFNTTCIIRDNLHRFPLLRSHAHEDRAAQEEKPILFLSEVLPERLRASVAVDALALLQIRQPRTEVRPAGRAAALRALAASTLHTVVPRPGRAALETFAALVQRVPAFQLLLGPDLYDVRRGLEAVVANAALPARV